MAPFRNILLNILVCFAVFTYCSSHECYSETCRTEYVPHGPLVHCKFLPLEFLNCSEPLNLNGNETRKKELGHGCLKYGGQKHEEIEFTGAVCSVLQGVECYGNKTFIKDGFPCIKYNGHYFVTTLIYSVLLGFLGMDRFCLGHTGTAVGKLLTLGGVGIWWIVDIVLLVNGMLTPDDGSNWVPYYWSRDLRKLFLKHLSVLICWKRAFFSTIFVKNNKYSDGHYDTIVCD